MNIDRYEMRCPKCGSIEKRKTAIDYGNEPL
jgi:exosome complex RNA-binding protein Csl4